MRCPFCDSEENKVIDSRQIEEVNAIKRRRECIACGVRFTTYEKIEIMPIVVIKRDKSRQPFEREKLLKGLLQACAKRPVSRNVLENIIDKIEFQLANTLEAEVSSDRIGELVLEHLKNVDEVAYVRFASVYRDFDNIDTFMKELWTLKKDNRGLN